MKNSKSIFTILFAVFMGCTSNLQAQKNRKSQRPLVVSMSKPNVVLIVSDDQGNADAGYQRSPSTVSTPAIDKLAADGVIFTNGYASGYVCAPTRAGLLTGRYQQRFGFYRAPDSRIGLPVTEITLADVLKENGYATGMFGKWHLGLTEKHNPINRGFDEFYGFLGHGGHDYFDLTIKENPNDKLQPMYRNLDKISDTGYLTDNLAREATSFIKAKANKEAPFFMYLPFNAVHTPMQAPEADIKKYNTGNPKRAILLAMLYRMDLAIGNVIETLKEEGVYDNTIIIFFSDNGGATASTSDNSPLNGAKHTVYEGGFRVPFIVSWPDKLNPAVNDEPVISIDVMPTICAALDIELPKGVIYDGKNILSAISGDLKEPLHKQLFFDGNDGSWAVREGDWKLLYNKKKSLELYNLKEDYIEQHNVLEQYSYKVNDLQEKYTTWRSEMGKPMEGDPKKKRKKKKKTKSEKKI